MALDKKIPQLEDVWRAGKQYEYCQKAADIARRVHADCAKGGSDKPAAKLLESLLSKEIKLGALSIDDVNDYGVQDLYAMNDLAWCLISCRPSSAESRSTNVRQLSRLLGKLRKEIIPNFKDKPVTMNVSPPDDAKLKDGVLGGESAIDPEDIADPVAKAKYKAAIRANSENSFVNLRQRTLREFEAELSKPIVTYIGKACRSGDISAAVLAECIKDARLSANERRQIGRETDTHTKSGRNGANQSTGKKAGEKVPYKIALPVQRNFHGSR